MRELFEKFIENRCPTFWERVDEGGWRKDKEELFRRCPDKYDWIVHSFEWEETIEGHFYWLAVDTDWRYIVYQEEEERDRRNEKAI